MFVVSQALAQSLSQFLSNERYTLHFTASESELFSFVEQHKQHLDCLVIQGETSLQALIHWYEQGILLPVVIFPEESAKINYGVAQNNLSDQITDNTALEAAHYLLHAAEVRLDLQQVDEISSFVDQAIAQFVVLSPASMPSATADAAYQLTTFSFLMQQRRLAEKLKERLGYLGVYYKRNSQFFLRHLSSSERQLLLENLKSEYRLIILEYFSQENTLNQQIDNFVDKAFFADISISRIVEIHMEIMEEFSKQLKLEGRSEEVLLDYRLTLIDVIAHLGEMYRRSIPRDS